MFENPGLPDARIVPWSRLEPGMIFIDGISINGILPEEFRDFPVLDVPLIDNVYRKYHLRKNRMVKVLKPGGASLSPGECVDAVHETEGKLRVFNSFRRDMGSSYSRFSVPPMTAIHSELVRNDSLIYPWGRAPRRPSMFNRIDHSLNLADILTETVASEYNFPTDRPCRIHLVADYSYSMEAAGRDVYVQSALNLYYGYLDKLLPLAEFHLYAFSDECREVSYPISGKEISRRETSYDSFLRKVLHNSDRSIPDVVLLFTDGLPDDHPRALERLELFPSLGIDYIQCIFNIEGDKRELSEGSGISTLDGYITTEDASGGRRLSETEYTALMKEIREGHSELAEAAGGLQVILHVDPALSLVSIEAFDHWLGKG